MSGVRDALAALASIHDPDPEIAFMRATLTNHIQSGEMNYTIRELLDRYIQIIDHETFTPEIVFELQVITVKLCARNIVISPTGEAYHQREDGLYPHLYGDVGRIGLVEGWKMIPWWQLTLRNDVDLLNYHKSREIMDEIPASHFNIYKKIQTIKAICK